MSNARCCCCPTCIGTEALAEGPVVLDTWNRYQTSITAGRATKQGFPWGWYPRINFYVLNGKMERDDILLVQHFKGKKKWGKPEKCRVRTVWDKKRGVARFECRGVKEMAINKPGRFSAKVTYKSVGADKVYTNIAAFSYKVLKFKADNRHVTRRFKPSAGFVVDHDFRIGEGWLSEVEKDDTTPTQLRLRTWFKYKTEISRPKARCYFGDKKIAESTTTRQQKALTHRPYVKKNTQGDRVIWAKHYWHFYKFAARPAKKKISTVSYPGVFYLNQNPGKYRCVITADGDKLATFHFEVGADGKVVHPPCQSATDATLINTLDSTHLVRLEYGKAANMKYSKKAFRKGPMYGKKWPKGCPL